jgi:hypothetical protein
MKVRDRMRTGCATCVLYVRIEVQGETLLLFILKQYLFDKLKYLKVYPT